MITWLNLCLNSWLVKRRTLRVSLFLGVNFLFFFLFFQGVSYAVVDEWLGLNLFNPKSAPKEISDPNNWMAIMGDSGATGAASSENLHGTILNLLATALELVTETKMTSDAPPLADFPSPKRFHLSGIEPMSRVFYSRSEFDKAKMKDEVMELNMDARRSLTLDIQEHGFGYMVGRTLGMSPQDIVLVGEDGKRVSSIATQFERIFEMKTETLPPIIFIFYTANDFCDSKIFEETVEARSARFRRSLDETWKSAEPFLIAHPNGTRIVVLSALEVTNVLTNSEILEQKVQFQGHDEVTCGQIRRHELSDEYMSAVLDRALIGMCPSVLDTKPTDIDRLYKIRAIQDEFSEQWKSKVEELNRTHEDRNLKWIYLEGLRNLHFTTGDVAHDCFHPSVRGHAKIADYILRTTFNK